MRKLGFMACAAVPAALRYSPLSTAGKEKPLPATGLTGDSKYGCLRGHNRAASPHTRIQPWRRAAVNRCRTVRCGLSLSVALMPHMGPTQAIMTRVIPRLLRGDTRCYAPRFVARMSSVRG